MFDCKCERKTFVEFRFPGIMVTEKMVREVTERAPEKIEVPEDAFAFTFFDRFQGMVKDEDQEIPVSSGPVNRSKGVYYIGGQTMTKEEILAQVPDPATLISNLEDEGCDCAIKTRMGNFQPFEDDDILIKAG